MKLRIADVMTQDVRASDLRFRTLKICSACFLFHNLYVPFSCHSSCFLVNCLSVKLSFIHFKSCPFYEASNFDSGLIGICPI